MLSPEKEAVQYVQDIDRMYYQFKSERKSRMDVEWGKWSRTMNLELKEKIKTYATKHSSLMRYVFAYWINRSQLLELYYLSKIGKARKKNELKREGSDLKKIILSGNPLLDLDDQRLKERMVKGILRT